MSASVRAEAKRLLALSMEGAAVSPDRVGAVLSALTSGRPAHTLRPLLRAYLAAVRRELSRGEARIEHAGPLSSEQADAVASHFSRVLGRPVRATARRNDALIAGLRVRVGDDVTDLTAASRLDALARVLSA
ncbi:MAG: F0F1 ATP synthase subunit delta [Opitutales bacterium]